jgi:hypothetical protein
MSQSCGHGLWPVIRAAAMRSLPRRLTGVLGFGINAQIRPAHLVQGKSINYD